MTELRAGPNCVKLLGQAVTSLSYVYLKPASPYISCLSVLYVVKVISLLWNKLYKKMSYKLYILLPIFIILIRQTILYLQDPSSAMLKVKTRLKSIHDDNNTKKKLNKG